MIGHGGATSLWAATSPTLRMAPAQPATCQQPPPRASSWGFPTFHNNSFLLGSVYEWRGVSLEYSPSHLPDWATHRPDDTFICANALTLDYLALIQGSFGLTCERIDYLQLDIDPSIKTLEVLRRMPLDRVRFSTRLRQILLGT